MITDDQFKALVQHIEREAPNTGFLLLMMDPADPNGTVLHAHNIDPKEVLLETLERFIKLSRPPLNRL